jgi:hypothetical protein
MFPPVSVHLTRLVPTVPLRRKVGAAGTLPLAQRLFRCVAWRWKRASTARQKYSAPVGIRLVRTDSDRNPAPQLSKYFSMTAPALVSSQYLPGRSQDCLGLATVSADVPARFATSISRALQLTGKRASSGQSCYGMEEFANVCASPLSRAAQRKPVSSESSGQCRAADPRISD